MIARTSITGSIGGGSGGAETWASVDSFTYVSTSSFTVANTAENTILFAIGRPIRYRTTTGAYRYGFVRSYSAGTVGLSGGAMAAGDDGLELGDPTRMLVENVAIPGRWSDAASTSLVADDLLFHWIWGHGEAYLVQIAAISDSDDTGATDIPRVNVRIDGSAVCTANTNAGIEVIDTSWAYSVVDMDTTNYELSYNDGIEVSTDANGANNDSTDLSMRLTFVLA